MRIIKWKKPAAEAPPPPGLGLPTSLRDSILSANLERMIHGDVLFQATVALPPTLSELTVNVGRKRVASREAEKWRRSQEWAVLFKVKRPIDELCHVWIRLGLADNQLGSDCANREKAATDLLVYCKVLKDDCARYVVGNHQVCDPAVPKGMCILEVRKA